MKLTDFISDGSFNFSFDLVFLIDAYRLDAELSVFSISSISHPSYVNWDADRVNLHDV